MFTENPKSGAPPLQVLQKGCQGPKLPALAKLQTDTKSRSRPRLRAWIIKITPCSCCRDPWTLIKKTHTSPWWADSATMTVDRLCHSDLPWRLTKEESRPVWCPHDNPHAQDIRRGCHQIETRLVYVSYMSARTTWQDLLQKSKPTKQKWTKHKRKVWFGSRFSKFHSSLVLLSLWPSITEWDTPVAKPKCSRGT